MEKKGSSLADRVFERLESDIFSGEYRQNEIMTENQLAADLGVSRTPIREAVKRLSQENLVRLLPNGIQIVGMTAEDIRDIYEIKRAMEGEVAARAAMHATSSDMEDLRGAIEMQEFFIDKGNFENVINMDDKFHYVIYKASKSAIFCDLLYPLHRRIQRYRKASVSDVSRAKKSYLEHKAIYEAISRGDADAARKLMTEHVVNAETSLLKKMTEKQ
jgi:DNA-binding GntR family transcriptional regulator